MGNKISVDLASVSKDAKTFFVEIEGFDKQSLQVEVEDSEIVFSTTGNIPITRIITDFNRSKNGIKESSFPPINIYRQKRVPIPNNVKNKKLDISFQIVNKRGIEISVCCQKPII